MQFFHATNIRLFSRTRDLTETLAVYQQVKNVPDI